MAEKRVRLVIERDQRKPLRWKLALFAVVVLLVAKWPVAVLGVVLLPALLGLRRLMHRW